MIKVLVVDDSALVRKLLGKVFSEEPGFDVAFARDGLEALAMLAEHQPDVVTLDIHMPQLDGLATLDRIMLERPCPVVMISSLTAEGAEVTLEALRLGAVDFLPKPGGAVSLKMDEFAPEVIAKVRSAASARLPATRRLAERIRHRVSGATAPPAGRGREPVVMQPRIAPANDRLGPHHAEAIFRPRRTERRARVDDFFELRQDIFIAGLAGRGARRVIHHRHPIQNFTVVTDEAELTRQTFRRDLEIIGDGAPRMTLLA